MVLICYLTLYVNQVGVVSKCALCTGENILSQYSNNYFNTVNNIDLIQIHIVFVP